MGDAYVGAMLLIWGANLAICLRGWIAKAPTHPAIVPGIVMPPPMMGFDSITMQVCALVVFVPFTIANIFEGARPGFYTGRPTSPDSQESRP